MRQKLLFVVQFDKLRVALVPPLGESGTERSRTQSGVKERWESPFLGFHSFFLFFSSIQSIPSDPHHRIIMDDPYEDRSMPADTTGRHIEQDDLLVDLENLKPNEVDYYAVLNLSKTVRNDSSRHSFTHLIRGGCSD